MTHHVSWRSGKGNEFHIFLFLQQINFPSPLAVIHATRPINEPDNTRYFSFGCLKWCPPLIPQLSISILSISMRNIESPCHISTCAFINDGWVKNCWETEKLFGKYGLILFANKHSFQTDFCFPHTSTANLVPSPWKEAKQCWSLWQRQDRI